MSKQNDLAQVIDLACLTEDRSPGEQRALLDVALAVDLDRGAFTSSNHYPHPPTLVAHVEATYNPSVEGERRVTLTKDQRGKYDRLRERWTPCRDCGFPQGVHPLVDLAHPTTLHQWEPLAGVTP
jgi:hypothetical protein